MFRTRSTLNQATQTYTLNDIHQEWRRTRGTPVQIYCNLVQDHAHNTPSPFIQYSPPTPRATLPPHAYNPFAMPRPHLTTFTPHYEWNAGLRRMPLLTPLEQQRRYMLKLDRRIASREARLASESQYVPWPALGRSPYAPPPVGMFPDPTRLPGKLPRMGINSWAGRPHLPPKLSDVPSSDDGSAGEKDLRDLIRDLVRLERNPPAQSRRLHHGAPGSSTPHQQSTPASQPPRSLSPMSNPVAQVKDFTRPSVYLHSTPPIRTSAMCAPTPAWTPPPVLSTMSQSRPRTKLPRVVNRASADDLARRRSPEESDDDESKTPTEEQI